MAPDLGIKDTIQINYFQLGLKRFAISMNISTFFSFKANEKSKKKVKKNNMNNF